MSKAFDNFGLHGALGHLAGQLEDRSLCDIVSRAIADTAGIGYGLAVTDVDGYSAEIPGAGDKPFAVTVRESIRDNDSNDSPLYPLNHEASLIRSGRIWVQVAGAAAGGQAYVVPDTGAISASSAGGNLTFTNASFVTATGSDGLALLQLNGN